MSNSLCFSRLICFRESWKALTSLLQKSSSTTTASEEVENRLLCLLSSLPDIVVGFSEVLVQDCSGKPEVFQLLALLSVIVK